jgi:carbon starvation protein CstA
MSINPTRRKPGTFLLFPWGLLSIVIILVMNSAISSAWFSKNWGWVAMILIIPAAILENLKVGYSTMKVMFLKAFYTMISFLIAGLAFGLSIAGWYYEKFKDYENIPRFEIPWYVLLAVIVMLLIEIVQIFSMLKAVKRELMQFQPDE